MAEGESALRQVKGGYLLAIGSAASGQGLRVPNRLVEFCLRQDWLEQSGGDLVLSQAGRARLRRSQTEGDPFREQHQLVDICCELKGLEEAERSHDWPQRAGKVVLQLGLTRLARHYGLDVPSDLPQRRKGIRHWGSADYRPTLDSWRGSGDQ